MISRTVSTISANVSRLRLSGCGPVPLLAAGAGEVDAAARADAVGELEPPPESSIAAARVASSGLIGLLQAPISAITMSAAAAASA